MRKTTLLVFLSCILLVTFVNPGYTQSANEQAYTGDVPPQNELILKNYNYYFAKGTGASASIVIIGVHRVNDGEYLVLAGEQGKSGVAPTQTKIGNLWRLESKEWVMADPYAQFVRYVKVLNLEKP